MSRCRASVVIRVDTRPLRLGMLRAELGIERRWWRRRLLRFRMWRVRLARVRVASS